MSDVKRVLFFVSSILLMCLIPLVHVDAQSSPPLPFLPDDNGSSNGKDIGSFTEGITNDLNEKAPEISIVLSTLFAIMFLIGVIKMSYALITKTGMVLKGSTGILIGIPIFVVCTRLFFILFFTTNGPGVTLFASNVLTLLIKIGFYSAVGMVLIGLLMKLFYKFLNHPEYARWSKRLLIGAGTLSLLTAVMPLVLQGI